MSQVGGIRRPIKQGSPQHLGDVHALHKAVIISEEQRGENWNVGPGCGQSLMGALQTEE